MSVPDGNAHRWTALVAVLAAVIMGPLDASAVNVNFPTFSQVFHASPALVGWVSMVYLLVMSCILLPLGRLGDMLGLKRMFLIGMLLFMATSALCGLAQGLGMLIAFRALQAVGSAIVMAMSPGIVTAIFPPEERGRALGFIGISVALGLALGPTLGGYLTDLATWRAIFFINLPIGLAAYPICNRYIKLVPRSRTGQKFDWAGMILAFGALTPWLLLASLGQDLGWSWRAGALAAAGLVLLFWFLRVEARVSHPLLDLGLFKNRVFDYANGSSLFSFMTQYCVVFTTPFLLSRVMHLSVAQSGAVMSAFPLVVLVVAPLSGILSDRIGYRWPTLAGSIICTLAVFGLSRAGGHDAKQLIFLLGLFGLGTGLFQAPNNSAVMGTVPVQRFGIAGAIISTVRNVGMVFGLAFAGAVITWRDSAHTAAASPLPAIRDSYLAGTALAIITTALCLALFTAGNEPVRGIRQEHP